MRFCHAIWRAEYNVSTEGACWDAVPLPTEGGEGVSAEAADHLALSVRAVAFTWTGVFGEAMAANAPAFCETYQAWVRPLREAKSPANAIEQKPCLHQNFRIVIDILQVNDTFVAPTIVAKSTRWHTRGRAFWQRTVAHATNRLEETGAHAQFGPARSTLNKALAAAALHIMDARRKCPSGHSCTTTACTWRCAKPPSLIV